LAELSKPGLQKDARKYFFSHRVIIVGVPWTERLYFSSIHVFKNRLNKIRMTRMGYFMDFWFRSALPDAFSGRLPEERYRDKIHKRYTHTGNTVKMINDYHPQPFLSCY